MNSLLTNLKVFAQSSLGIMCFHGYDSLEIKKSKLFNSGIVYMHVRVTKDEIETQDLLYFQVLLLQIPESLLPHLISLIFPCDMLTHIT